MWQRRASEIKPLNVRLTDFMLLDRPLFSSCTFCKFPSHRGKSIFPPNYGGIQMLVGEPQFREHCHSLACRGPAFAPEYLAISLLVLGVPEYFLWTEILTKYHANARCLPLEVTRGRDLCDRRLFKHEHHHCTPPHLGDLPDTAPTLPPNPRNGTERFGFNQQG